VYLTNTDALSRFDVEGDAVEHDRTVRRVPRNKVFDPKVTRSWPGSWRLAALARRNLLFNIEVALDALEARLPVSYFNKRRGLANLPVGCEEARAM
jgi:hypothetical protein